MHTLKPGDWVVVNNSIENIIKVEYEDYEEDGIETRIFIDHSEECYGAEDVEMWQPKPSEWCWFWNNDKQLHLDKLHRIESNKYVVVNGLPGSYADHSDATYSFEYCKPFIGQLPSSINDNK